MRRREFLGALGSAVVLRPIAAPAQQGERLRRIGILMPFPSSSPEAQARVRAFREELRKRGWAAGINVQFEERWTGDNMDLIRSAAAKLVELNPDVIVAVGGRVIPILMTQTRTIPIVIPGGADPVARGYVESLAHPGGNVTGFALMEISVIGKMLQTLKDISSGVTHVSMIYNPDNPATALFARAFAAAAEPLGVEPAVAQVHDLSDIERVVAATAAKPDGGVLVPPDITIEALAEQTIAAVARSRMPAIYPQRSFVLSGGLIYYGTDRVDLYRNAATYVDRILRGEKVGDLPYQQPTKYELVINMKTARELGLSIPPRLLFTADEVIE
jgi:putative ABC transport system substrate-binding protein